MEGRESEGNIDDQLPLMGALQRAGAGPGLNLQPRHVPRLGRDLSLCFMRQCPTNRVAPVRSHSPTLNGTDKELGLKDLSDLVTECLLNLEVLNLGHTLFPGKYLKITKLGLYFRPKKSEWQGVELLHS